ncbi:MAG: response regulator transcription factor [FCB group bacterium]|jgi:DNA-binding response OmpR family regulator|nr:response regulator transcription factor [FCB group bacterium]
MVHPKTRILIADDDPLIRRLVGGYLERLGCAVVVAEDTAAALEAVRTQAPDVVVLDIIFPEDKTQRSAATDGVDVLRRLREWGDIPVVMLSGVGSPDVKVRTLNAGADDYLSKPFHLEELVARIEAVLRRTRLTRQQQRPLHFQRLRIDPLQRAVWKDDQPLRLTRFEFDLLYTLAQHPRRVFSRERLLLAAGREGQYSDPQTIDVHIRQLRRKLEDNPAQPAFIKTVRGVGYRFEDAPM